MLLWEFLSDLLSLVVTLGVVFCTGFVLLALLILLRKIVRCDSWLWERNRRAVQLAKRFNRGSLTKKEQEEFNDLHKQGIIKIGLGTRSGQWVGIAALSEMAVSQVLGQ